MDYLNWIIDHIFELIGAVIVFLLWFTYGVIPMVVKLNQSFNRSLTVEQYDPDDVELDTYQPDDDEDYQLPIDLEEHFAEQIDQMRQVGFEFVKYFVVPDMMPNTGAIFCTFINDHTGDMAMSAVLHAVELKETVLNDDSVIDDMMKKKTLTYDKYVEFMSKFADGSQVCTMNSTELQGFKPSPTRITYQLPTTRDLSTLYKVHQKKAAEVLSLKAPFPAYEQWGEFIRNDIVESLDQQRDDGLLHLNEAEQKYMMTWRGVFAMVYPNLWPFKGIAMKRIKSKEQELLREAF